jgi:alkanesulfonate monooxygenase SsuD/methylene tetrahydromethanopterin reductase-like flavin-dependent oxidoreductase (luciferase family)
MPSRPSAAQMQQWMSTLDTSIPQLARDFESLWISDHFFWGDTPTMEAWTTLSFMAARWPDFKVGTMVLDQGYRNPALLAKMAATLQVLTKGRLILGIGAGWKEDEYYAYNFPFPPAPVRLSQLEDTLEIMRRLWTQSGPVTFEGAHYRVQDAYLEPKPRPIPPILIGGSGKRLLNIAARYADWWNMTEITLEHYADRVRALRAACEQIGRDPASIRPTWWGRVIVAKTEVEALRQGAGKWTRENALVGTPEQVAEQMQAFMAAGASYFMTIIPELPDPDVIGMVLEDVLPKVRAAASGR